MSPLGLGSFILVKGLEDLRQGLQQVACAGTWPCAVGRGGPVFSGTPQPYRHVPSTKQLLRKARPGAHKKRLLRIEAAFLFSLWDVYFFTMRVVNTSSLMVTSITYTPLAKFSWAVSTGI